MSYDGTTSSKQGKERLDESKISNDNLSQIDAQDDLSLEHSFEVIPSATMNGNNNEEDTKTGSTNQNKNLHTTDDIAKKLTQNAQSSSKTFQERVRKSKSFLSKLQSSSTGDSKDSPGIPSSIASAFSSFTSSFSLNSSASSNINNDLLNSSGSNNNNSNNNHNNHASSRNVLNFRNNNSNVSLSGSLTIETASNSTNLSQSFESKEEFLTKKASVERKNLVNLTKLIVKDLIATSLTTNRAIDDSPENSTHLKNYFTLVEKVLKHGLKQNLLSNRSAGLWATLEALPKLLREPCLISESVRSLTHVKTSDGKIRAWVRLAMMQKKLPEYLNQLLANKGALLKDIYHDYAFMLNDEAHVFAGLIIGVNVIDCNFFAKDANLDFADEVIDLSPYLKAANCFESDCGSFDSDRDEPSQISAKMQSVLDQKSYLEEYSKRLESTITNMETKIKCLEEQNNSLEEHTKASEARIQRLLGKSTDGSSARRHDSSITDTIKDLLISTDAVTRKRTQVDQQALVESDTGELPDDEADGKLERVGDDATDLNKKADPLAMSQALMAEQERDLNNIRERISIIETSYRDSLEKIKALEHELDVQTSANADKDVTIKIYERDIKDNQTALETLRKSLVDSNKLNTNLTERLNEATAKLREKSNLMEENLISTEKLKLENKTLATRLRDKQSSFVAMKAELEKALKTIDDLKGYNVKINDELVRERESGQSFSVTVGTQSLKITELLSKVKSLEKELEHCRPFKEQASELAIKCKEYERSLEEIGAQLRESRLELEELRENSSVFLNSQWVDSKQVKSCASCQQLFSVTRRKHHCRLCGNVFCQSCSDNKMDLASSSKPVRVCDTCHPLLLAKFVKSSTSNEQ